MPQLEIDFGIGKVIDHRHMKDLQKAEFMYVCASTKRRREIITITRDWQVVSSRRGEQKAVKRIRPNARRNIMGKQNKNSLHVHQRPLASSREKW